MISPANVSPPRADRFKPSMPVESEQPAPFDDLLSSGEADAGSLLSPGGSGDGGQTSSAAEMFNERGFFSPTQSVGDSPSAAAVIAPEPVSKLPAIAPVSDPGRKPDIVVERDFGGVQVGFKASVPRSPLLIVSIDELLAGTTPTVVTTGAAATQPPVAGARSSVAVEPQEPAAPSAAPRQAPPEQPASNISVRLGGTAGVTVSAEVPLLTPDERERLERRLAGELARHGLTIGQIVVAGAGQRQRS